MQTPAQYFKELDKDILEQSFLTSNSVPKPRGKPGNNQTKRYSLSGIRGGDANVFVGVLQLFSLPFCPSKPGHRYCKELYIFTEILF